ncbi:uncharacterized protein [Blastocystis hominis]|uniref:Glycolipid transfer protein domain-containing protein n=1 Tax=Blastocystis hominis TaxID=12968 RepID=D8M2Y6_BLAHO|nr:uncharacterized protein [Blastocystis hominis]CBK22709.2 unnamed protein product [Blastocystis hominis]|eukprot:XP_012896757.1 uncharacterized protein [Blastocystis hominis]
MTNEQEFSLVHFTDITSKVASLSPPYKLDMILEMFDEITKLFHCLGAAMSFATSDVTQKLAHVRNRTQEMLDAGILKGDRADVTLQKDVMLAEKKMNWHMSGSDGIDKKGKEFQNASRSIIRLTWFLDFVYEMVAYMRANETETLPTAVKYAYNKVLADRHSMMIRNAFKVAVIICPSKDTFLTKVSGNLTQEQVNAMWVTCEENMKKISDMLWAFYKSEGMENLP